MEVGMGSLRSILSFILCTLLSTGCMHEGHDSPSSVTQDLELPEYPFEFDVETPGGILIQTNGFAIPQSEDIDRWYEEVQQCVAEQWTLLYPGRGFDYSDAPPFVIVEDTQDICGDGDTGIYCQNYSVPLIALQRAWAEMEWQWKHEAIHSILAFNEFDTGLQLNHLPRELWACDGIDSNDH